MSERSELLNRPMFATDLRVVEGQPWAQRLRRLVAEYASDSLPVMNGSFAASNLREGKDQALTCGPYRLWEYASLFLVYQAERPWRRVLDVGGAASPLPYLLAESGIVTHALDLQPLLVAVCNHVAAVRGLPLTAAVADIAAGVEGEERYDAVVMISVIEHIDPPRRPDVFRVIHDLLEPGGLLYLTFDYGTYARDGDTSIGDVAELCATAEELGFAIVGNDPRSLPPDVLALKCAPRARAVARRMAANAGVFDAATPLPAIAKYLFRRVILDPRPRPTRFDEHNFFRLFLCRQP
jgi:SAM-dependent methyltransferase